MSTQQRRTDWYEAHSGDGTERSMGSCVFAGFPRSGQKPKIDLNASLGELDPLRGVQALKMTREHTGSHDSTGRCATPWKGMGRVTRPNRCCCKLGDDDARHGRIRGL